MKTVDLIPSSRAAHATAWPWLPALAATTPAARSSAPSSDSLFTAPRTLNDPVRCRFSAFSQTLRPTRRDNVSEPYTGVARAWPRMRPRAASTLASVGAVFVANVEHLLKDVTHRRQRAEPPLLHLVEQAPQLRIVRDALHEEATNERPDDLEQSAHEKAQKKKQEHN